MNIKVGAARMMGDGSGDASVSVSLDGGRKRQVRVVRGMDESWLLYAVVKLADSPEIRLIHPAAAKDCPKHWGRIDDRDAVRDILTAARQVMADPKLQRGVLKAIAKRKEREKQERIKNTSIAVRASLREMLRVGATHEQVMQAVNEELVKAVQET